MSEESARYYAAAQQSGVSSEEAWERMQELNQEVEWDIQQMLPEVFNDDEQSARLQKFSEER